MVHSDPELTDNIDLSVPKNNVDILWRCKKSRGERRGAKGNGIAGNGAIAACTYHSMLRCGGRDNLVIYDYEGNHLWTSGKALNAFAVSSTPMVDIHNRVIACDNEKILMVAPQDEGYHIKWKSSFCDTSRLVIPFSPTIVDDETVVIPTKNGPVYAYDAESGKCLDKTFLGRDAGTDFSTINSACVHGDRVYILTESARQTNPVRGRLYALDVVPDARRKGEVLQEAWHYSFEGRSQASPLYIDNTIYFDGYTPGLAGLQKNSRIHAVTDCGDTWREKWQVEYPHRTWFSFSKDPRGGFWYENSRGKRLTRFDARDGTIIEEISVKNLVPDRMAGLYVPMSCMTICNANNPIMLISAISLWPRQYLIAVDLHDNSVVWRVEMKGWNYAGGQFTILTKEEDTRKNRVVFGTYWDGVIAVGTR